MSEKNTAVVSYWNPERKFGFCESRTPMAGGGFSIESFFLHCSQIVFQVSEDIQAGNYVRFRRGYRGKRDGDLFRVIDAEIFESKEQCETLDLLHAAVAEPKTDPIAKPAAEATAAGLNTLAAGGGK